METSGCGVAPQQRHFVLRDADILAVLHHNTVLAQRASESHRELAQTRLRHADALRIEMEGVRGKLRVAEEDAAHKQGLISHNNHQVSQAMRLPGSDRQQS